MAAGAVEAYVTPGNHSTILQEPQVRQVAERLGALLERREARVIGAAEGVGPQAALSV
jgi:hypothetical protein